jgi:predicted Zn-dependent protease
MSVRLFVVSLVLLSIAVPVGAEKSEVPDNPVFRAMTAELARAREQLRIEDNPSPYFVSATVSDVQYAAVAATFGAVTRSITDSDRTVGVTVRVGDRKQDSSNFMRRDRGFNFFMMSEPPEEDDERELRRSLWLGIDDAYKTAVEDLARKKAVLEGQMQSSKDELADFTTEEPATVVSPAPESSFDLGKWEELAAQLSGVFREFPEIQSSRVSVGWMLRQVRYADTDGGTASHPRELWMLEATAETQADDGMPLRDFVSFYAPRPEQAPDAKTMTGAVKELAKRLVTLRSAPVMDGAYSGPVLLEDQAAAEFLLALAGMGAAIARDPVFEDPRFAMALSMTGMTSPWKGKLGSRVIADFIEIVDDPTRSEFDGTPLIGSYRVDDEGVPAAAVTLVEEGRLKGVLATRTPVKGADHSNGHARGGGAGRFLGALGGPWPFPGVLVVTAVNESPVAPADARARLLELLGDRGLEYGYLVRRIQNEAANPTPRDDVMGRMAAMQGQRPSPVAGPIEVVRIGADGSEQVVRGAGWGTLDARTLRDILLASSGEGGQKAFNLRASALGSAGGLGFGFSMAMMGGVPGAGSLPVSVIAPRALLLEEAELEPSTGPFPNPPALSHPHFAKQE